MEIRPPEPSHPATAAPASPGLELRLSVFSFFFFFSGFCGLLYEVIWLRLGMANFGVTTPVVSLFVSVFMGGLGLGSWAAGAWMRRAQDKPGTSPLRLYAVSECLIGLSALVVPVELGWARSFFVSSRTDWAFSPAQYFSLAGLWIVAILLPWCMCMGATFPLAMAAIRRRVADDQYSFSQLYLANVLGAIAGALLPAFVLIELFGFRATLKTGAAANLLVSAAALALSLRRDAAGVRTAEPRNATHRAAGGSSRSDLGLLFLTGLVSLAMEIVWIRQFTPYMGTEVYSFAWILGCYLIGTCTGSRTYRRWVRRNDPSAPTVAWLLLGLASLLPLLMSDPRVRMLPSIRVALGIMPLSGLLGFVTPQLVDRYSRGDPDLAGKAYAMNVAGCIVGPLLSGFLLLPALGEHWSLVVLAGPLLLLMFIPRPAAGPSGRSRYDLRSCAELTAVALALLAFTRDFVTTYKEGVVRRDHTATVVATGTGMNRRLVVNGVDITVLTPITKYMAHMPLAYLDHPPRNALVICFGMGTTHRSLLSWGIDSTAVELLPSVPQVYGYFHRDGPALLQSPRSHLVIDDGRLFLEKSRQQFDVITIDPPPPVTAAGVSFLYSRQFYDSLKPRLRPGGILQQWTTGGDRQDFAAIAKALRESFPYVRCFVSVEEYGLHFLASMSPIPDRSPAELAARMPPAARADLLEWFPPDWSAEIAFAVVRSREIALDQLLAQFPEIEALDDDRPINEYHLLRDLSRDWSRALNAAIPRCMSGPCGERGAWRRQSEPAGSAGGGSVSTPSQARIRSRLRRLASPRRRVPAAAQRRLASRATPLRRRPRSPAEAT